MRHFVNNAISVVLTTFVYLVGGIDVAMKSLLIVIVIDYITGVMGAIYNKELNSTIGLKGILKKFSYLIIVSLSVILDRIVGDTGAIRTLVIYFFVANDGISIVENIGKMGVPLPKKLTEVLEQLRNKGDEESGK